MTLSHELNKVRNRLERLLQSKYDLNKVENFRRFLTYIENNLDESYYNIAKIQKISNATNIDEVIDIVEFFSTVLEIEYIYLTADDELHISRESYINTITNGVPPINMESGIEITDFEIEKLSFYCTLNS